MFLSFLLSVAFSPNTLCSFPFYHLLPFPLTLYVTFFIICCLFPYHFTFFYFLSSVAFCPNTLRSFFLSSIAFSPNTLRSFPFYHLFIISLSCCLFIITFPLTLYVLFPFYHLLPFPLTLYVPFLLIICWLFL